MTKFLLRFFNFPAMKGILHAMIIFLLQYRFKQNNQYRSEMKRKCTQYLIKLEFKFRLA